MISNQLQRAIQHHQNGDIANAMALYKNELEVNPASGVALDGLGVAMIQLEKPGEAIPLLQAAIEAEPSNDLYYFHLGQAFSALQDTAQTVKAYQAAAQLSPQNTDYHFLLGEALSLAGQFESANQTYLTVLQHDPRDVMAHNNIAMNLLETGDPDAAEEHLKQALNIEPRYGEALINLASVALEKKDYSGAVSLCHQALAIDPGFFQAYYIWGESLFRKGNYQQALECIDSALQLQPQDTRIQHQKIRALLKLDRFGEALPLCRKLVEAAPSAGSYLTLSHCLISLQNYPEAETALRCAIDISPDLAEAHFNLGTCLEASGAFKEAALSHRQALTLNPELTDAAYHLTLIDPQAVSEADFRESLARLEENRLPEEKQFQLYFALAKKAEKQGEFEHAFTYLQQANSIKAELFPFDLESHLEYIEGVINVFDARFFELHAGKSQSPEVPVFIVGMPRSGSTLIEQILGAHPAVCTIGEHPAMPGIVRDFPHLSGIQKDIPGAFNDISQQVCQMLRQRYLESVPEKCSESTFMVDKMLGNFIHLGLIALIFPSAKIIHSRRHPLDTLVSCFSQNFSNGLRFSTDLPVLAAVYDSYLKLMSHWRRVLPVKIKDVVYENLVTSTESVTRELLEFCDLPWSDSCLQHHHNASDVSTASFQQVRKPVYTTSVGSWKRYQKQIEALKNDWPALFQADQAVN